MSNIFNADNPFFRGVNKVIDVVVISCLWTILNIPAMAIIWVCFASKSFLIYPLVFLTMALSGPATVSLYYASLKSIRHNRGYMAREFFSSFKDNFKQGFAAGAIFMGLMTLMGVDIYLMYKFSSSESYGSFCAAAMWVFVVFAALILMWSTYLFSYIARFSNDFKTIIKNSIAIALINLPKTLLQFVILVILMGPCVVSLIELSEIPPLTCVFFFLPGCYILLKSLILEKTFSKYMSEEDKAAENERNQVFKN